MIWEDIKLPINYHGTTGAIKKIPVKEGLFGVYVQPGISKDRRYNAYPYWRMFVDVPERSVKTENGRVQILFTPGYPALRTFLRDVLVHEYRVDITRHRKSDFKPKRAWLKNLVWDELINEAQMEITAYNLPEIYKICGIMKGEME